jgi:hypothetical protein
MKTMREMIKLMEGVVAVPGVGKNKDTTAKDIKMSKDEIAMDDPGTIVEKSTSEKQARFMAAAAHDPKFAKKAGIDQSVAKEFNQADTGTKQLSNAMKKDECSMSMFENKMSEVLFHQSMDRLSQLSDSFVPEDKALEIVAKELEQQGVSSPEISTIMAAIEDELWPDTGSEEYDSMIDEPDNMSADGDALASAGHGSDEDYGGDDFPMEDIQNGYNDVNDASGNDYFPNGADSPVVSDTGPSGARQGDNPEQKKMQVDEVHTELVYGYRNYLRESSKK